MTIKTAAQIAEDVTPFDGGKLTERAPLTWEEVVAVATAAIEADRAQRADTALEDMAEAVAAFNAGARRAFCIRCERGHEGPCTGPQQTSAQRADRECSRCGDEVTTLSSDDECAACEALPKCDECDTREGDEDQLGHPIELSHWPRLIPPVQMCPSCEHNARRSGWEPGR